MDSTSKEKTFTGLFCSSLRSRVVWQAIEPDLRNASGFNLEESDLKFHDMTFSLYQTSISSPLQRLEILILEPASLEVDAKEGTLHRIAEFSGRTKSTSNYSAITLLLSEKKVISDGAKVRLDPWIDLQSLIFEAGSSLEYMHIIPIEGPSVFLSSIKDYMESLSHDLTQYLNSIEEEMLSPVQTLTLLRHMTATAPHELMAEHDASVISDLFPSFQALSIAVRTVEGYQLLEDYLGPAMAKNVFEFWENE